MLVFKGYGRSTPATGKKYHWEEEGLSNREPGSYIALFSINLSTPHLVPSRIYIPDTDGMFGSCMRSIKLRNHKKHLGVCNWQRQSHLCSYHQGNCMCSIQTSLFVSQKVPMWRRWQHMSICFDMLNEKPKGSDILSSLRSHSHIVQIHQ